jgi:hypothetical protein
MREMKGTTSPRTNHVRLNYLFVLAVLFLVSVRESKAFAIDFMKSHKPPNTALHAWSMPHDHTFAFRTWYNEYNPTARVTVYNEYVALDTVPMPTKVTITNEHLTNSTLSL